MPTGACGINCDMCRLRLMGICSTCDFGGSDQARRKLRAQERIFGGHCAILKCADMNRIPCCLRDCPEFPCENFSKGPYPFSRAFLEMQARRRADRPPAVDHNNRPIEVPEEFWDRLGDRNLSQLCNVTLAEPVDENRFVFRFLRDTIRVDVSRQRLERQVADGWDALDDPLLEIVTLLYCITVNDSYPMGREIVGPSDLKEAHYFSGRHALPLSGIVALYGTNLQGFRRAAEHLHGTSVDMADVAYRLHPFPRVPLYYLLWEGDAEFPPKVSVLFDRSIEQCFEASGIWALVSRVNWELLKGPGPELD